MKRWLVLLLLVFSACQAGEPSPAAVPASSPEEMPTTVRLITKSPISPARGVIVLPTSTPLSPTGTLPPATAATIPASYEPYTIDFLRSRTYGGGNIEVVETLEETEAFTRYLIRYPSDGLNIYGFANVPKGEGPFPVIIAIHGYVDPAIYQTLDYTSSALDAITQAGYIVIHPNLRNYPPSDSGDNLFRVGMTVDVLNLIALVKSAAGPSELFAAAAPQAIGLWGHSMGGDIALRVLTVSADVKATALFASLSGDELKNADVLFRASADPLFQTELNTSPLVLQTISPMYYYSNISSPIQLQHGELDEIVPIAWAQETCEDLTAAGVATECIYYPTEGHTFRSRVADQVYTALFNFYEMHLSP